MESLHVFPKFNRLYQVLRRNYFSVNPAQKTLVRYHTYTNTSTTSNSTILATIDMTSI